MTEPPLRACGDAARLTAGLVHIIDDDPEAIQDLLHVAGGRMFEHKLSQLREDRAAAKAYAEAAASYTERGFTVLDDYPADWRDTSCIGRRFLRSADGAEATDAAVTQPAQWAVFLSEKDVIVDKHTGELVNFRDIDWQTERQPDREPAAGMRHADTVEDRAVFTPEWFCLDYVAAGLQLCEWIQKGSERRSAPEGGDDPDTIARATPGARTAMRRSDRAVELMARRTPWILRGRAGLAPATGRSGQLPESLRS